MCGGDGGSRTFSCSPLNKAITWQLYELGYLLGYLKIKSSMGN